MMNPNPMSPDEMLTVGNELLQNLLATVQAHQDKLRDLAVENQYQIDTQETLRLSLEEQLAQKNETAQFEKLKTREVAEVREECEQRLKAQLGLIRRELELKMVREVDELRGQLEEKNQEIRALKESHERQKQDYRKRILEIYSREVTSVLQQVTQRIDDEDDGGGLETQRLEEDSSLAASEDENSRGSYSNEADSKSFILPPAPALATPAPSPKLEQTETASSTPGSGDPLPGTSSALRNATFGGAFATSTSVKTSWKQNPKEDFGLPVLPGMKTSYHKEKGISEGCICKFPQCNYIFLDAEEFKLHYKTKHCETVTCEQCKKTTFRCVGDHNRSHARDCGMALIPTPQPPKRRRVNSGSGNSSSGTMFMDL